MPLFDWLKSGGTGRFLNHPVSENLVRCTASFREAITDHVLPSLGFDPSIFNFEVTGLSILIQPPVGGVSQVIHTDDHPLTELGEWISMLFPCHPQRATVFLRNFKYNSFGSVDGVKPFLNLGDICAWSKVKHFGSGAEVVPFELENRLAMFAYVHVTVKL